MENPEEFERTFAKAWFKLTHRDMEPKKYYVGPYVPQEEFIWQDPLPERNYKLIDDQDVVELKKKILASGLNISQLVYTAWSSASIYRDSDRRGGTDGAGIGLYPLNQWEINHPQDLEKIIKVYKRIQKDFNQKQEKKGSSKRVSLADLIVLGGYVWP